MKEPVSPWSPRPACPACDDFRLVEGGKDPKPCPNCGGLDGVQYKALRREHLARGSRVEISLSSLSEVEVEILDAWTVAHPSASQITLLSWIEGRRYDPSRDQAFLASVRPHLDAWLGWHRSLVPGAFSSARVRREADRAQERADREERERLDRALAIEERRQAEHARKAAALDSWIAESNNALALAPPAGPDDVEVPF